MRRNFLFDTLMEQRVRPRAAWFILCTLLLAFRVPDAGAQTNTAPAGPKPSGVVVPFETIRGHIIVLASANDSRQVSLMLDTGYTINMLSAIVERITRDIVLMATTPDADRAVAERGSCPPGYLGRLCEAHSIRRRASRPTADRQSTVEGVALFTSP